MLRAIGRFAGFAALIGAVLGIVAVVAAAAPDTYVAAERAVGGYLVGRWAEPGRRAAFLLSLLGSAGALALVVASERWIGRVRAPAFWEPIEIDPSIAEALAGARGEVTSAKDAVALLDEILRGAVRTRASDVHLWPTEGVLRISYRVHGVLEPIADVASALQGEVLQRIKVLAKLTSYVHDVPQDGRLPFEGPHGAVDVRVSLLPTEHGEKAVLRLARGAREALDLKQLGFGPKLLGDLTRLLVRPQGIVFLSGPTGSGKTTTLYAALQHIALTRGEVTNIVTIEDPVEFDLPFLSQTQVRDAAGLTFARGLRAILRQDPNVIMIGEIRDPETAGIAVQAGMTGHLILTTVHTDSAGGAFARLIDMGIEPFLLASASLASMSQRLVRTLCESCRRPMPPTPHEAARLRELGVDVSGQTFFAAAERAGCPRCEGKGFSARFPLGELLLVSDGVRELIHKKVPTMIIQKRAVEEGMVPLLLQGLERARSGDTSLAEVLRVAG